MLHVEEVYRSFGDVPVLQGVSFSLEHGSVCGLIGPSGSGKSVLLKIIGGVNQPDLGQVRLSDQAVDDDCACQVGLMFQEGALFDSLNVVDNVAFPLVHGGVPVSLLPRVRRREVYTTVCEILDRVGLYPARFKMPAQLSGGMRRRVSLARALVSKPPLVLLDDPTCGLDPVASSVIMNLILELHHEYTPTLLIVSHDLRRLLPVVERIFALYQGKVNFSGTLDELRAVQNNFLRAFVSSRFDLANVN